MSQSSGLSRYDHFKAIFSRHSSQEPEVKGDTTSEITLVPRHNHPDIKSMVSPRIIMLPTCASALAAEIDIQSSQ